MQIQNSQVTMLSQYHASIAHQEVALRNPALQDAADKRRQELALAARQSGHLGNSIDILV
jgi:hypothetical protein